MGVIKFPYYYKVELGPVKVDKTHMIGKGGMS